LQVPGHELAVEQTEAAKLHACDQPCHGHLGRIGCARKHAFAKKCPAQCQPVQPANHLPVAPAFNAMGQPQPVQVQKGGFDFAVDPCLAPAIDAFGAQADDPGKIAVDADDETVLPDRLRQRFGNMELIERQNRPLLRLDPEGLLVFPRVGHGKDAVGISVQEQVDVDRHDRTLTSIAPNASFS
jgi:hypothetical protein